MKRTGVDFLRYAVRVLDNCREDFNDRFTTDELLKLMRRFEACGWDITPDRWTTRQILEALQKGGRVPQWDNNERPVYK